MRPAPPRRPASAPWRGRSAKTRPCRPASCGASTGSPWELRQPPLEEAPLGVRVDELQCAVVRLAGVVGAVEPPQQLGARRVQVVVGVELQAADELEGALDLAGPGQGARPVNLDA